jgi:hypothetical protein
MRTPRLVAVGLATITTLAIGTACDNTAATPTASAPAPTGSTGSAAPADPQAVAALSAAAAKLGTTSFKITATSGPGFKLTGAVDPPGGNGTSELTASGANAQIDVKTLLIGQDLYVQVPGITKAGTWTHLDVSRLPAGANVGLRPGQIDPVNTANLLSSSTDVHATGGNSYAGTLDLTKAVGIAGLDKVTIEGYGNAAVDVPFTAGVDAQGRLTALTINVPGRTPIEALYTDYGTPVQVTRPAAASITEAPDNLYTALGA